MFCVSGYSTTEKLKLLSSYQDSNYNLEVFADYHGGGKNGQFNEMDQTVSIGGTSGIDSS